jgi:hypothetical protein
MKVYTAGRIKAGWAAAKIFSWLVKAPTRFVALGADELQYRYRMALDEGICPLLGVWVWIVLRSAASQQLYGQTDLDLRRSSIARFSELQETLSKVPQDRS